VGQPVEVGALALRSAPWGLITNGHSWTDQEDRLTADWLKRVVAQNSMREHKCVRCAVYMAERLNRHIILLILGVCSLSITSPSGETRAIWWTPKLNLKDRSEIVMRLRTPFEGQITVAKNHASATVANCIDYLNYAQAGYKPQSDRELAVFRSSGIDCQALQILQRAVPARISYLDDFRLDQNAPNELPPQFAVTISPEELQSLTKARARGLSWQQYQPQLKTEIGQDSLTVIHGDARAVLEIYAKGDFNRDGIEDIMIREDTSLISGTYSTSHLFVLTREGKRGALRVLKEYE